MKPTLWSQTGRDIYVTSVSDGTMRFEYDREVCALEFTPRGINRDTYLSKDLVTYNTLEKGVFSLGNENLFLKYFDDLKLSGGLLRDKKKEGLVKLLSALRAKNIFEKEQERIRALENADE